MSGAPRAEWLGLQGAVRSTGGGHCPSRNTGPARGFPITPPREVLGRGARVREGLRELARSLGTEAGCRGCLSSSRGAREGERPGLSHSLGDHALCPRVYPVRHGGAMRPLFCLKPLPAG